MSVLSNWQKQRIKELTERNKIIVRIVEERIDDPAQFLPLNLILESRFNELAIAKIKLEADVQALRTGEIDGDTNSYERARIRLERIRGQLRELQHLAKVTRDFDSAGRNTYEICQ